MNSNVALGILSFLVWSIFSTWLYVNFIRVNDPNEEKELFRLSAAPQGAVDSVTINSIPETVNETNSPIHLSKSFTFHKNTAVLIRPAVIGQFTDSLGNTLNDRNITVTVTGFACDLGKEAHNYNLGLDRANYIVKALKASGITLPEMTVKSQGESNPIVPNTSEKSRVQNRRVNILITSKS
jgi:outer membrane protein OmpA-like peptidoglycan-associated protein